MPTAIPLHVNGQATRVTVDDPDMPLLYALRDNLGLHGPRSAVASGSAAPAPYTLTAGRCAPA